jgi:hypothetical protein
MNNPLPVNREQSVDGNAHRDSVVRPRGLLCHATPLRFGSFDDVNNPVFRWRKNDSRDIRYKRVIPRLTRKIRIQIVVLESVSVAGENFIPRNL